MRILFCNKYNFAFSGTEQYLFEVMARLRECGHETALFSMVDPRGAVTPYDRHFVSHMDFKSGGVLRRASRVFRAAYSLEARRKLRGLIRDFRPDVAHVRNIYHHLTPSILWELKSQNIPVLYHVNDFKILCPTYNMVVSDGSPCERCQGGRFWNVVREGCHAQGRAASLVLALEAYVHRWLRTYERCVDRVLAPSAFVKQKLVEDGWPSERVDILAHFQPAPPLATPHPGNRGTVLYFGRLSAEKGIQDVLSAASQLPHLQFVIAGEGPKRAELEAFARSLRLQNIAFAGNVCGEALGKLIAQSQFTLFPSHAYETFGKTIIESYAQARPVVATDIGSRRELVQPGETGLLYPPGDICELTAAISFLSQHPHACEQMGIAARRLVLQKYSPEEHLAALTAIYERLTCATTKAAVPGRPRRLSLAFIGGRGVIGKYSGVETFYEEVGKRLAAKGYDLTVYCRKHFTPDVPNYLGMKIVRLPTIGSKHLDTFLHTLFSTLHACGSNCDIVHYQTLGPSLFSFVPRLFGKKTIVTVQGLDWQRRKWSWFARQVLKAAEWTSVHFPDKTVVVSRTLQNYYRSHHHTTVAYVPNGTEIRPQSGTSVLDRFGLIAEHYVLFLGRFSPEKNCDLLIDAFLGISTHMVLVLAGGSSHTDAYVSELRKHQCERIKFLDWLTGEDLQQVLGNAALFVLPSDLEGLSLALLDAMAAGRCVLASDIAENCEVAADAGFTFRHGDVRHLRSIMTTLLADAELRRNAGQRARERVRQLYLWEDVVSELENIYWQLLNPAPVSADLVEIEKRAA